MHFECRFLLCNEIKITPDRLYSPMPVNHQHPKSSSLNSTHSCPATGLPLLAAHPTLNTTSERKIVLYSHLCFKSTCTYSPIAKWSITYTSWDQLPWPHDSVRLCGWDFWWCPVDTNIGLRRGRIEWERGRERQTVVLQLCESASRSHLLTDGKEYPSSAQTLLPRPGFAALLKVWMTINVQYISLIVCRNCYILLYILLYCLFSCSSVERISWNLSHHVMVKKNYFRSIKYFLLITVKSKSRSHYGLI